MVGCAACALVSSMIFPLAFCNVDRSQAPLARTRHPSRQRHRAPRRAKPCGNATHDGCVAEATWSVAPPYGGLTKISRKPIAASPREMDSKRFTAKNFASSAQNFPHPKHKTSRGNIGEYARKI